MVAFHLLDATRPEYILMLEDEFSFWNGLFSAGYVQICLVYGRVYRHGFECHGFECLELLPVLPSVPVLRTCLVEELLNLIVG